MESKIIYILLTLVAGVFVTFQGPMNATLGKGAGSVFATFWSFLFGTIIIGIFMLIKGVNLPSLEILKSVPFWAYFGAVTGIIYVAGVIIVIPQLGAGLAMVLLILAQVVTALLIDHFGLLGVDVRSIDLYKIIGLFLMVGGVYLVGK